MSGVEADGLGLTGLPDFAFAEPSRDMRPELLSRPWTVSIVEDYLCSRIRHTIIMRVPFIQRDLVCVLSV